MLLHLDHNPDGEHFTGTWQQWQESIELSNNKGYMHDFKQRQQLYPAEAIKASKRKENKKWDNRTEGRSKEAKGKAHQQQIQHAAGRR